MMDRPADSSRAPPAEPAAGRQLRGRLTRGWLALGDTVRGWVAPRCIVCDIDAGDPVCAGCAADWFAPQPRCPQCAQPLPAALDGQRCGRCVREAPAFDATWALASYAPPVSGMVLALKYGHRLALAHAFGRLLAARVGPGLPADGQLLPVPLAFERQAERGFNQAREIARALAARTGLPLAPARARRVRHTPPQESLDVADRHRNVRNVFAADPLPPGTTVVVVDDVMTTGATLDALARTLKRAGAAQVVNVVVARTP
jgi:ComF family protein